MGQESGTGSGAFLVSVDGSTLYFSDGSELIVPGDCEITMRIRGGEQSYTVHADPDGKFRKTWQLCAAIRRIETHLRSFQ